MSKAKKTCVLIAEFILSIAVGLFLCSAFGYTWGTPNAGEVIAISLSIGLIIIACTAAAIFTP